MIRAFALVLAAAPTAVPAGALPARAESVSRAFDLRGRLEALLAWDIEDEATPDEVARKLARDALFAADREAAEEVLGRLLEASAEREELREAEAHVAAMNYWFRGGTSGDPAVVGPLRRRALADPELEGRYPLLAHEINACILEGRLESGLRWNAAARACLDEADPVQRLERETFLDGSRGMLLTNLARFQDAAAAVESAREHVAELLVALRTDARDPRRFVWQGEELWEFVALARLALPLAQTRFERVEQVHAEIAGSPEYAAGSALVQARLELRLALAEVEGQRRGLFPGADPVGRLNRIFDDLVDMPVDRFRAKWWAARARADHGDFEGAADLLASARTVLEEFPEIARNEPLVVALECRDARNTGEEAMRAVLPRLEEAYARLLEEWSATPLDEAGTGYAIFEEWNLILSELITLRDTLEPGGAGAERALEDVIAAQVPGSLSRRLGGSAVDLERIRSDLLAPGEGALVYAFGRERIHLLLVDREAVVHVPLGADFELDAAREELLGVVRAAVRGEASVGAVEGPAARYARVVLPDAARTRLAAWDGVVVVGLEAIGFVPFELLRPFGEELGGARLGEARALRYLPSFPVAVELLARDAARAPATRELSLFAAPECGVAERDVARYVLDDDSLAALVAPYASARSWAGSGDATVRALRAEDVGAAVVTHCVVHGERDLYRPRPGGLRLWQDGGPAAIWADELETLPASPVVVLTSCEAGRAPLRRGDDGVGHLGAAFFLGGASTVLLSHTDIGLAPSVAALARFHAHLRAGEGAAEAMRAARAELTDPVERFHAALVHVTGLAASRFDARAAPSRDIPDREIPARSRRVLGWGAGLAAAIALALVLSSRRRRASA